MKYIVITVTLPASNSGDDPFLMRFPFIFPDMMVHAHVAKAQCLLLDLMYPKASRVEATSAGSVNSPDFEGEAYGKSDTLKLASDPSDTLLIRQCDYGSVMTVPAMALPAPPDLPAPKLQSGLSSRLIEARCAKNWTQSELGRLTGVHCAQISRYEAGHNTPRPVVLHRLAQAMGVSTEWLKKGTL